MPHLPAAPLSLIGRLCKALSYWLIRPALHEPDVAKARRWVTRLCAITLPAWGARYKSGRLGGVPVEWVRHGKLAADSVLLYLHGGAFLLGSPQTHRAITTRLARDAGVVVAAIDYRMAPEQVFPAAVEDALAAYRALLAEGWRAEQIALAGDSAGGGLCLSLCLALKQHGLPQPAAVLCISPWCDLRLGSVSMREQAAAEVVLSPALLERAAGIYAAGRPRTEPLLSPLLGDLSGLPPLLIQVGGEEILLDDSLQLHAGLMAAGARVELQRWNQGWHVFHLHAGLMPEANQALEMAAAFIGSALARR